jgi:glycosyltransferase involved in cell wall biosynthesis
LVWQISSPPIQAFSIRKKNNPMKQDHLTLGIPAYTTFRGGGLMHFLLQAVPALSAARPNWNIELVGSIALPELQRLAAPNVHLHFWDNDPLTRAIYQVGSQALQRLGKGSDAGYLLQKRFEMYGLPWGQTSNRVAPLQQTDVLWAPHYNISLDRISLYRDLRVLQMPVLFTIHDIHSSFYPEDHPVEDLARFYQGFVPLAQTCQHIFTHSQFQKSAISRHLRVTADKISVTPQPPLIDPLNLLKAYDPTHAAKILSHCGIHRAYAFYPASTTHTHKNHTRLLAAWAQLKNQMGPACPLLVCTGKGSQHQYDRLASLVAAFRLQDDVLFTGPIDTPTLATLFQNCELVIIPTLYEGAGSGILTDALVTGRPVACADIPQVHEQLAALGAVRITFFDPYITADIANAVQTILANLDSEQDTARQNRAPAQTGFVEMWRTWAEDYAQCIEGMTTS